MTAAQFEELTLDQAEVLLRQRLRQFLDAGAEPGGALILAAHVEIDIGPVLELLAQGCSANIVLRILFP